MSENEEIDTSNIDAAQLKIGLKSESIHDLDLEYMIGLIKDHLKEDPKYYTHLTEMENKYYKKGRQLG